MKLVLTKPVSIINCCHDYTQIYDEDDLEKTAQDAANRCEFKHTDLDGLDVGENLALRTGRWGWWGVNRSLFLSIESMAF